MGQSLVKNYLHIVFSTKYRQQLIYPFIEAELYNYLGGICHNLECFPVKVGGWKDHVHVLCSLSKKIALMTLMQEMKSHSSSWIKTKDNRLRDFYWQDGYGAFSVNPHEIHVVKAYIENQQEHHGGMSFKDGFRGLLKKYEVEYDERYVWD